MNQICPDISHEGYMHQFQHKTNYQKKQKKSKKNKKQNSEAAVKE